MFFVVVAGREKKEREEKDLKTVRFLLTMMACITLGFCIAAASSGSFMIFAIMSAGVTPSSWCWFFGGYKKRGGKKR